MSLGQLALPIATTPAGIAHIGAMDDIEAPDFALTEAGSKDEVLGCTSGRCRRRRSSCTT